MDNIVFYPINGYKLLLRNAQEEELNNPMLVEGKKFVTFTHKENYDGKYLLEYLGPTFKEKSKYMFLDFTSHVAFHELSWFSDIVLQKTVDDYIDLLKRNSEYVIYKFRHTMKENLLEALSTDSTLYEYTKKLCEYAFSDHFSLWSYNDITEAFTCEATSLPIPKLEMLSCNSKNGLHDFLINSTDDVQKKPINEDFEYGDLLKFCGIKSVTRIRIKSEDTATNVIVSFYSKRKNFELTKKVTDRARAMIKLKYIELVQKADDQFDEFSNNTIYRLNESNENFLNRFTQEVCNYFKFEACSIFLAENNRLKHASTTDVKGSRSNIDIEYDIDDTSLTGSVALDKTPVCCYNLEKEEKNSHKFDEHTDCTASNWIAVPLTIKNELIGVIRVKNKYAMIENKKEIRHPLPIVFSVLMKASANLQASLAMIKNVDELKTRLKEQRNFNRVLLHEIRTPISKFSMGPEVIKKTLEKEKINREKKRKVFNQLTDIQIMGGRLKMITDSYNIDEIIKLREISDVPLLSRLIYPIMTITKPFLEKQHDCFIDVNQNYMHGRTVLGDENLYGIALNALIDNAAKYCNRSKPYISVSCIVNEEDSSIAISIRNIGYEISEDERKRIFEEGYRGKKVVLERIHGTGIGLYLTKRIMEISNGDLILVEHEDPSDIEFRLIFPTIRVQK